MISQLKCINEYCGHRCAHKCGKKKKKKKKKEEEWGTDFVSEITPVEDYPDFEILAHVIQHGLQGFIVKNIQRESAEANDPSNIF